MLKSIQHTRIETLLTEKISPIFLSTWRNSGEGIVQILSQVSSQAYIGQSSSDSTSENWKVKFIEITIIGWEHQKFYILPEDAKRHPYPKPRQPDFTDNHDDVMSIVNCLTALLLDIWRTTKHGSIVITSERNRNGNIEVLIGTTPSRRFTLDPNQLTTSVTEEIT
jgi:hypothetical protein